MLSEHFRDFDAFVASVRGVDSTMMIQNPARHSWDIEACDAADIRVQRGRLGSGNIVEGQSWTDCYMLYLPLSKKCVYAANGAPIPKNGFMILEPGCEFRLATKFEHDWACILIPAHALDLDPAFETPKSGSEKMICRVTRPDSSLARRFRNSVHEILGTAGRYPELERSPAASVASAGLLKLGQSILGRVPVRDSTQRGRPRFSRDEVIRRSQALLEEFEHEHVSVSELAMAAAVSERTLRTVFEEVYGVGPARYLHVRNLHRIHRALRAADPEETTVSKVLLAHSEWEIGRVAGRYRRLFGELPSETLRAKRR